MKNSFPYPKRAAEVISLHRNNSFNRALFDVVHGLSDEYLKDLDEALETVTQAAGALPEAIQFVLRRAQCIEDAERVVASVCARRDDHTFLEAA
ncbi:MAG: hypothetical protein AAF771_01105 [Pseudomonadota bacterium]